MIADFHIHSKYSFDSIMEPKKVLSTCKKRGYDAVAITDHNSIKGALEAKQLEDEFGIKVFVGEEVQTEAGDIIGINLGEAIRSRAASEVLEEIGEQGAISILPHPFKGHRLSEELLQKVDVIEGFNARLSPELNAKAVKLAEKWCKPIVAGSDAHLSFEIGLARNIIDTHDCRDIKSALLNGDIETSCFATGRHWILLSQLIRIVRLRQYGKILTKMTSLI